MRKYVRSPILRWLLGGVELMQRSVSYGTNSQSPGWIGEDSLKTLYQEQVRPHGPQNIPGAYYRGLRIMAVDGATIDMPDEVANADYYGYPPASRCTPVFPKLRFVAMVECGTQTLCYAEPGPYARKERDLAFSVMAHADAGMLVTAAPQFYSYPFWKQSLATGAKLLFRLSSVLYLPREEVLSDGSYLSRIFPSPADRKKQRYGISVRVVEYTLKGLPNAGSSYYRLITNWLNCVEAPAQELVTLYHQRGTIASSFETFNNHLLEHRVVLRGQQPELVEQEFYALLLIHSSIRHLMTETVAHTGQTAQDKFFHLAVRILRPPSLSPSSQN